MLKIRWYNATLNNFSIQRDHLLSLNHRLCLSIHNFLWNVSSKLSFLNRKIKPIGLLRNEFWSSWHCKQMNLSKNRLSILTSFNLEVGIFYMSLPIKYIDIGQTLICIRDALTKHDLNTSPQVPPPLSSTQAYVVKSCFLKSSVF